MIVKGCATGDGGSEEHAGSPWALPMLWKSVETLRVYHCSEIRL